MEKNRFVFYRRKIRIHKRFIFLKASIFLSLTTVFAQKIIVVNYDDSGIKYTENPFTDLSIKPNSFEDGEYIFYFDSTKTKVLFKGWISKGLTNGDYYVYKKNRNGDIISKTETIIKSYNGKLDGICKVDFNNNRYLRDTAYISEFRHLRNYGVYQFYFDKGQLSKLEVVNPFFRDELSPSGYSVDWWIEKNLLKPIPTDTLIFLFQNGRIKSVRFYNHNSFYAIQPLLKNDCVNDTAGIKKISESEKTYIRNIEYKDSLNIMFQKEYKFNDKLTDWEKGIYFYYDSLKTFNRIALVSAFPTVNYAKYYGGKDEYISYPFLLLEMEFNKDKCLRYLRCRYDFQEISTAAEDGGEEIKFLSAFPLDIYFLSYGILDLIKY